MDAVPTIWTTIGTIPRADVKLAIRFERHGDNGISCIVTGRLKATEEIVCESVYTQVSGLDALIQQGSFGG